MKRHSRYSAALQKNFLPRASFSSIGDAAGGDVNGSGYISGGDHNTSDNESRRTTPLTMRRDNSNLTIRRASMSQLPSRATPEPLCMDESLFEIQTPNLLLDAPRTELGTASIAYRAGDAMYTLMVVTCYSEGEAGLKSTIDSLVMTDYPDDQKILFIVADGLIRGEGNALTTPEICVDLMEVDPWAGYIHGRLWSSGQVDLDCADIGKKDDIVDTATHRMATGRKRLRCSPDDPDWLPPAYSYVAIADGEKRHNMARVFAGHYNSSDRQHRVPALIVVKCGTPAERNLSKPGNRGKRDSQIILMCFLQKVLLRDRMTPLEYDMFIKMRYLMSITPDLFEAVLCVDADTVVAPSSLAHMTAVFKMDPMVMGLCGETQIANKTSSWVTTIQVFEYFISHHLNKAFESIFGGVTCLPGCFCMYRIKAPKQGGWVPILASTDIHDFYSENVTDTLHKKNLLLLGEDRYLTTLLLKTFPKRKMMFVPSATCQTLVPDAFSVLLSQRRRWINSTVHNLFELVLVNDLCGTFCCSMQFVIFMELVGTLVLPAAILFTIVLLLSSLV